jgi:hypothetical protein
MATCANSKEAGMDSAAASATGAFFFDVYPEEHRVVVTAIERRTSTTY